MTIDTHGDVVESSVFQILLPCHVPQVFGAVVVAHLVDVVDLKTVWARAVPRQRDYLMNAIALAVQSDEAISQAAVGLVGEQLRCCRAFPTSHSPQIGYVIIGMFRNGAPFLIGTNI